MQRIDPNSVPDAFVASGLAPLVGHWAGTGCGCLAILLLARRVGKQAALATGARWDRNGIRFGNASCRLGRELSLRPNYVLGLVYGWDGRDLGPRHPLHTDAYHEQTTAGYADGVAAREACVRRGLSIASVAEKEEAEGAADLPPYETVRGNVE